MVYYSYYGGKREKYSLNDMGCFLQGVEFLDEFAARSYQEMYGHHGANHMYHPITGNCKHFGQLKIEIRKDGRKELEMKWAAWRRELVPE